MHVIDYPRRTEDGIRTLAGKDKKQRLQTDVIKGKNVMRAVQGHSISTVDDESF